MVKKKKNNQTDYVDYRELNHKEEWKRKHRGQKKQRPRNHKRWSKSWGQKTLLWQTPIPEVTYFFNQFTCANHDVDTEWHQGLFDIKTKRKNPGKTKEGKKAYTLRTLTKTNKIILGFGHLASPEEEELKLEEKRSTIGYVDQLEGEPSGPSLQRTGQEKASTWWTKRRTQSRRKTWDTRES